jgi:hypothetical protein
MYRSMQKHTRIMIDQLVIEAVEAVLKDIKNNKNQS